MQKKGLHQFQGIVNPENEDETEEMKRTNALYLLKLKETNFLTQTSLDSVVQGTTGTTGNRRFKQPV